MIFAQHITKKEIQNLPLVKFAGKIHLVESPRDIGRAVRHLQSAAFMGFDTEKKPTFQKGQYHPTALVQLSTLEEAFLFRLTSIGFHDGLKELLESPSLKKIGISIKDDLAALNHISSFSPEGFLDLNDIASEIGINREGVRNLCAIFLEKRVSKNQQTSNWENETLTQAQMTYAATDAWICGEIYHSLVQKGYIENGSH